MVVGEPITFDGRGPLASAVRAHGGTPSARTAQQAFVAHLRDCLIAQRPAVIDAETGVGKTLAYLIPMLEKSVVRRVAAGEDEAAPVVVVSTATVSLQKQLMESDLPVALDAIERSSGVKMSAAFRVGRGQVVDPDALLASAENHGAHDLRLADEMREWCVERIRQGSLPLRADLFEAFADRFSTLPAWLTGDLISLRAEGSSATSAVADLYAKAVEDSESADVLVVNHHLLTLHLLRPFLWADDREAFVVVDEADRLPGVVEDIRRSQVPLRVLQTASGCLGPSGAAVKADVEDLADYLGSLFGAAWQGGGGGVLPLGHLVTSERDTLIEKTKGVQTRLDGAIRLRKEALDRMSGRAREELATVERYCLQLDRIIRSVEMGDAGRSLLYYTPVRNYPGLAQSADGAAMMVASRLWKEPAGKIGGLLFTSATLSTLAHGADVVPKRALSPFVASLGFKAEDLPVESFAVIAPHRFGEMNFVRPARNAPSAFIGGGDEEESAKLNSDAVEYWAEMVVAAHARGGRALVLVPAYRDVMALASALRERLGDALVAQTPGYQTSAAVAQFLSRDDAVWISAAAWEGVSLPGAISHIVIPRLPIRPNSFEDSLLQRYLSETDASPSRGRSITFGRRMADARRRLRQGIGRGIRSHDDKVTIWLGDARWPIPQAEIDREFIDQPTRWSATMMNAVSARFRGKLDRSPRFCEQS